MSKIRVVLVLVAMTPALVASLPLAGAEVGARSGLYEIVAGNYSECCGKGGVFKSSLPNEGLAFVRVMAATETDFASMAFLGKDMRTAFSIVPCPGDDPIQFNFDHGFAFPNRTIFHADPGPLPLAVYWNYTVSNAPGGLRIDGTLGTAHQQCV